MTVAPPNETESRREFCGYESVSDQPVALVERIKIQNSQSNWEIRTPEHGICCSSRTGAVERTLVVICLKHDTGYSLPL